MFQKSRVGLVFFSLVSLLLASGCAELDKWGKPQNEQPPQTPLSKTELRLSQYEAFVDETLNAKGAFKLGTRRLFLQNSILPEEEGTLSPSDLIIKASEFLDIDISSSTNIDEAERKVMEVFFKQLQSHRKVSTELERVTLIEVFNDCQVAAMRDYIRTQTIHTNRLIKLTDIYKSLGYKSQDNNFFEFQDKVRALAEFAALAGVQTLGDLELLEVLEQHADKIQKEHLVEQRQSSSLEQRIERAVVRSRNPDGGYVLYSYFLNSILLESTYDYLGNFQHKYRSDLQSEERPQTVRVSEKVRQSLEASNFDGVLEQSFVLQSYKIDPEDNSRVFLSQQWRDLSIQISTVKGKHDRVLFAELEDAEIESQEGEAYHLRIPLGSLNAKSSDTVVGYVRVKLDLAPFHSQIRTAANALSYSVDSIEVVELDFSLLSQRP